jgi:fumarate hydratase, class II
MKTRTETDTFGPIEVADRYWGAQAQRSLGNFKIGWEKQPKPIVRALGIVKRPRPRPTWRWASSTQSSARPSSRPRRR